MYMYIPFEYDYLIDSPMVSQWALRNKIKLFNYDDLNYNPNPEAILDEWFERIISEGFTTFGSCENHPYVESDRHYLNRKKILVDRAKHYNIPVIFLTADWKLWYKDTLTNSAFVPAWYFIQRRHSVNQGYKNYQWSTQRNYNFSCLNMANYRSEKINNYIECFKRKRKDKVFSITDENCNIWENEIRHKLPDYKYDLLNGEPLSAHASIFLGYTDSYCNLVMEHSMETEIVSEKSFKPFLAKQIPVFVAQKGTARFMTDLGFDIFYDFINHNEYDNVEWFIDRINAVHNAIDRLYQCEFNEFIKSADVQQRLQKNFDYFYSDNIDKLVVAHLNKLL